MGDFIGFTFGGKHIKDLGVTRVSEGDRYEEEIFPELKDRTTEVPGLDGSYYFGAEYGPKKFDLSIAYDHLTEEQFRELRQTFGRKDIKELVFDERPYKKYMAKVESPIELSFVCFDERKRTEGSERNGVRRDGEEEQVIEVEVSDSVEVTAGNTATYTLLHTPKGTVTVEGIQDYTVEDNEYTFTNETEDDITITISYVYESTIMVPKWEQVTPWEYSDETERIYKGEGKISFICYFPFAKSVFKQLPFTYQKTTDETIQEGKKYFILDGTDYELVEEPTVDDIDTYYERVDESNEWAFSSGILSVNDYEEYDVYNSGNIKIYNPGDKDTGFKLYLPAAVATSATTINYKPDGTNTKFSLVLKAMTMKSSDVGVVVDTVNGLIIGVQSFNSTTHTYTTSNNIYNEYVDIGIFFQLEPCTIDDGCVLNIVGGGNGIEIFYDYLYF